MTTKPKKKLCWNCEGRVTFAEENCPYCGVYLNPLSDDGDDDKEQLFAPPYRAEPEAEEEEHLVPPAPYVAEKVISEDLPVKESKKTEQAVPEFSSDLKTTVLPLVLLLAGSVLFLFSFALVLFSQHGILTLKWNGEHWFVYLLLAVPLLFLGWRYTKTT